MADDTAAETRSYLAVFAALLALTVATVGAGALGLSGGAATAVGLLIATAKASLVAVVFMHLMRERKLVHIALAVTAVFCAGLFALTLLTEADHVPGTRFAPPFDAATP